MTVNLTEFIFDTLKSSISYTKIRSDSESLKSSIDWFHLLLGHFLLALFAGVILIKPLEITSFSWIEYNFSIHHYFICSTWTKTCLSLIPRSFHGESSIEFWWSQWPQMTPRIQMNYVHWLWHDEVSNRPKIQFSPRYLSDQYLLRGNRVCCGRAFLLIIKQQK